MYEALKKKKKDFSIKSLAKDQTNLACKIDVRKCFNFCGSI